MYRIEIFEKDSGTVIVKDDAEAFLLTFQRVGSTEWEWIGRSTLGNLGRVIGQLAQQDLFAGMLTGWRQRRGKTGTAPR